MTISFDPGWYRYTLDNCVDNLTVDEFLVDEMNGQCRENGLDNVRACDISVADNLDQTKRTVNRKMLKIFYCFFIRST